MVTTLKSQYQGMFGIYQRAKELGKIPKETTFEEFDNVMLIDKPLNKRVAKIHLHKKRQISNKENTRQRLLAKLKKKKESKCK